MTISDTEHSASLGLLQKLPREIRDQIYGEVKLPLLFRIKMLLIYADQIDSRSLPTDTYG